MPNLGAYGVFFRSVTKLQKNRQMPLLQIAIRRLRGSSINTRNNSYIEVLFEKSISMSELHQED